MSPLLIEWYGDFLNLVTGKVESGFVDGVTQPFYTESVNFTGDKNVGISKSVSLTPYSGNGDGNQIIQITDGALYEGILFRGMVEVRSAATFVNCMFLVDSAFVRTDVNTRAVVLILNGTGAQDIHFQNCEIHVRAQRAFNGIMGRNFTMDKSVVSGAIDPMSESASGSAPNTGYGFKVTNSCIPSVAWWYANPANTEIHSDTGSHSDGMQKNTTLSVEFVNCTIRGVASEIIGTGTPGSGRTAGNTYTPGSGTDYTASQSQMESWRSAYTVMTNAAQSMFGESRRILTEGSMAAFMLNLGNITIDGCWLDGGSVTINATDVDIVGSTVSIKNNTFWNGMGNGHGSNPATKGHAILASTGHTFASTAENRWADELGGALLTRQLEGGFAIWR